jgi:pilus assembly protein CpaB
MNRRLSTILLIAFVVAAASSYLVYRVVDRQMHPQETAATTRILVAAHDLELGAVIKDADLSTAEWVGTLPKTALTKKESVIGRGVVSQLYQGEPIVDSRLAAVGAGGGLAATIPPGMRACAVRVNDIVGVAGFVVPGMRVDVIISGTELGVAAAQGPKVKTILQNIQVLSAGTNIQKDNEGKPVQVPVVNLLVTPDQAEMLSLASNETRIQLVLRNPLDNETAKTSGVAMASLFSGGPAPKIEKPAAWKPAAAPPPVVVAAEKAPLVKAPEPQVFLVQIMNGSKRSEEKFSRSEDTSKQ